VKATTYRDPIHRDARYDPLALALLDTEELQRLGRIYQLGYAHLVFRGGTHTRLSHALGAAHVAGQIIGQLRRTYLEAPE
jgi:HD superfamily phosphohydrolase